MIQPDYLDGRKKKGFCAITFYVSKDRECSCNLMAGHLGLHRATTWNGKNYYWGEERLMDDWTVPPNKSIRDLRNRVRDFRLK